MTAKLEATEGRLYAVDLAGAGVYYPPRGNCVSEFPDGPYVDPTDPANEIPPDECRCKPRPESGQQHSIACRYQFKSRHGLLTPTT